MQRLEKLIVRVIINNHTSKNYRYFFHLILMYMIINDITDVIETIVLSQNLE